MNKENKKSDAVIKSASDFDSAYSSFKDQAIIVNKFSTLNFSDFYGGKRLNINEEKHLVNLYQTGKSLLDYYISYSQQIPRDDYLEIIESTNRAMDLLVFQFFGLAIFHAKRYRGLGVDYPDLVQQGLIAIIQIVQNYSYPSKRALSTEISWRMRNKMYRSLATHGSNVKLPEDKYRIYYQYKIIEEELTELKDDDEVEKPSRKEILDKVGVDEHTFREIERFAHIFSIDNNTDEYDDSIDLERLINNPFGSEDISYGRVDRLPVFPITAPQEVELLNKETQEEIKILISSLPEKNKIAINMRFGFDDDSCKTYEDIAKELNTNKVQASRLVKEGLLIIKKSFIEFNLDSYFLYDI